MSFISLLRVETKRIFLSPLTWLTIFLSLAAPIIGLTIYKPATQLAATLTGIWMGDLSLAGAVVGAFSLAILTLYELDRIYKSNVAMLTDSIVSPVTLQLIKTLSLLAVATTTGLIAAALYLPITLSKVGGFFDWVTYAGCWIVVYLPSLWIGCLMSAAFYHVSRRADFSFVLFTLAAAACFIPGLRFDFILRWIDPDLHFLSDIFGNAQALRMALWNRLVWLAALSGLCILSLLCVRRYGKSLPGSLAINGRYLYKPVLGLMLMLLAARLYAVQPFVSRYMPGFDRTLYYSTTMQYSSPISLAYTLLRAHTYIEPDMTKGTIDAVSTWSFVNRDVAPRLPVMDEGESFKMYMQINGGLNVRTIMANGVYLDFEDPKADFMGIKFVTFDLPYALQQIDASALYGEGATREGIELTIRYGGYPLIWRHDDMSGFFGPVVSRTYVQFATYTGNTNTQSISEVLPVFWPGWSIGGGAMSSTVDIILPKGLTPVSQYSYNGSNSGSNNGSYPWTYTDNEDGSKTWRLTDNTATFKEIYAADYLYEHIDLDEERSIDFYYSEKNLDLIEKHDVFGMISDVYAFCINHISPKAPYIGPVIVQSQSPMEIDFSSRIIQPWWSDMRFVPERGRDGRQVAEDILGELYGLTPPLRGWNSSAITEYWAYRFADERFGAEYAHDSFVAAWKSKTNDYYSGFYTRNPAYKELVPLRIATLLAHQEMEALDYNIMPLMMYKAEQMIGADRLTDVIRRMYDESYDKREGPIQPELSMTVDEFWDSHSVSRPEGELDGYFTLLYEMVFDQSERPETRAEFISKVPFVSVVSKESGLAKDEPISKMLTILYDNLSILYGNVQPVFAFADFLDLCGLAIDEIVLTPADYK